MKKFHIFLLFTILFLLFTIITNAQTACLTNNLTIGLISSSQPVEGLGNPGGNCAVDESKIAFAPFKIPSYDDLKSLYFTQSKAAKVTLGDWWIPPIAGETVYYRSSDLEVNSTRPVSGSGVGVFFIDGKFNIKTNITFGSGTEGLVFVVKGDINIDPNITRVDAVLISQGTIYTAGAGCEKSAVSTDDLTVNGSLVSLSAGSPIRLCRTLADNSAAAEKIVWQPKYLVILRNLMSDTYQKWAEIQ